MEGIAEFCSWGIGVTRCARFYAFKRRLIKWPDRLQASTGDPLGLMTLQVYGLKKRYTCTFFNVYLRARQRRAVLSLVQIRATWRITRDDIHIYCSTIIIEAIALCRRTNMYIAVWKTSRAKYRIYFHSRMRAATNAFALPHLWRRICLPANVISVNTIELPRCSY